MTLLATMISNLMLNADDFTMSQKDIFDHFSDTSRKEKRDILKEMISKEVITWENVPDGFESGVKTMYKLTDSFLKNISEY